jgi:RNA polymerase sigma-70 factor (ECF subfamily)
MSQIEYAEAREPPRRSPRKFSPPVIDLSTDVSHGGFETLTGARQRARETVPAAAAASSSDESLIKRIAGGDKLAMQVLYTRHHVRVFRFVVRLVHDESMAEDLISEVFLDVWRQADRFEGRSAVSTWLMSIARFKVLSARRRRTDAELGDKFETTIADPADDPAVTLEKKNQSDLVRHALTKLSAEHREVIDLIYYHEQSVAEAAHILGIPAATVKTRMFYARKNLGEWLQGSRLRRVGLDVARLGHAPCGAGLATRSSNQNTR